VADTAAAESAGLPAPAPGAKAQISEPSETAPIPVRTAILILDMGLGLLVSFANRPIEGDSKAACQAFLIEATRVVTPTQRRKLARPAYGRADAALCLTSTLHRVYAGRLESFHFLGEGR